MSFLNISDILYEYNRDNQIDTNTKSCLALSNTSELEIKNLLKQIDMMIHHKRLKWERQKQDLDNKMKLKEQESLAYKANLDQKNAEINQLKKLIQNMDTTTKDVLKKYENEIETLQQQLGKLKIDYGKVLKKYRHLKNQNGKNGKGSKTSSQPNSLNSSFRSDGGVLGGSAFDDQQQQMMNLKAQLNEHKLKELQLIHEKENLFNNCENLNKLNDELQHKLISVTAKLSERKTPSTAVFEKKLIDNELRKRDEYIKNLENTIKSIPNDKSGENSDFKATKEEAKKYKKLEANARHELNKLKMEHEQTLKRLNTLDNENRKLKSKANNTIDDKNKNIEIANLKKRLTTEKERHLHEIQKLNEDIYTFSNQLEEKNVQVISLNEKLQSYEKLTKEKDDKYSKLNQELTMTLAHVDALRLENQFLRQSIVEKKTDENEVIDMNKKYHQVIDLTEKENKRLKKEVIQLTQMIEDLRKNSHFDVNNEKPEAHQIRRLKSLKEDFEKQHDQLKIQQDLSIKRLNSEIEKLMSEKYALQSELDSIKNKSTQALRSKQLATTSSDYTSSLSQGLIEEQLIPNNNRRTETNFADFNSHKKFNTLENVDLSPTSSLRSSFGTQVRLEEHKRKKELENILDSHIDALRQSSGSTNDLFNNILRN